MVVPTMSWRVKTIFMKLPKLVFSFSRYSDQDLLTKAQYIVSCMTGNPNFPAPIPPLVDVQEAIATYAADLIAASGRDRVLVSAKNESRLQLEMLLTQLGMFVMYTAFGNLAMLTSSGFTIAKEPEPNYITNPGNVTLLQGVTSGELESMVENVKGARVYLHQITDAEPTASTVWDSRTCSRSRFMFKSLLPGKKYWVRIAATASGEQIAYSNIASQFVL